MKLRYFAVLSHSVTSFGINVVKQSSHLSTLAFRPCYRAEFNAIFHTLMSHNINGNIKTIISDTTNH